MARPNELPPAPPAIGRYLVESTIGAGSAGLVYRATDPLLDRPVAIKVPRRGVISEEAMTELGADFYREAAIAGRFQHPHVVTIYDVGRDGALDYMVMELVEGSSVRELIETASPLPVWDVLSIAADCCRGLDFIHYRGVVHRDIKPGNILVAKARDVSQLVDFSVAHRAGEAPARILGTVAYMSPEAFRRGHVVDERNDIFGLGVTLYEMLTGERPFGSGGKDTRERILNEEPPRLDTLRPEVPVPVVELVAKAMAKAPADRFQTALEFADAIHAARHSLAHHRPDLSVDANDAYISLRRSEWFGRFAPELVNEMLEVGQTEMYDEGAFIVREGAPGDAFYLVLHGAADVIKHGQVVGRIESGEFFGEIALIASEVRAASVMATEPVLVWKVGRALLDQASATSRAGFYEVFLSVLVKRLGDLTGETAELRAAFDEAHRILGARPA